MHKLNREALLSWASYNHSGTFVPLFAIGCGAGEFHGVIDNTDIPRIMRELKGFKE
jgi:alkaline phosphatase